MRTRPAGMPLPVGTGTRRGRAPVWPNHEVGADGAAPDARPLPHHAWEWGGSCGTGAAPARSRGLRAGWHRRQVRDRFARKPALPCPPSRSPLILASVTQNHAPSGLPPVELSP